MTQHLYLTLLQAFFVSFIGGACGAKYAYRITTPVERLSGRLQIGLNLAAGIVGAPLAVIFGKTLESYYPFAPEPNLLLIQFLLGFAIAKILTKRLLRTKEQNSQSKGLPGDA